MSTRAELVAALAKALPPTWQVRPQPIPFTNDPGPKVKAVIVVERTRVQPAPNVQGSLLEEHHVWVIQPSRDAQTLEDQLDDNLDVVLEALRPMTWLNFESAERSTFADTFHAYDITVQLISNYDTPAPAPTLDKE